MESTMLAALAAGIVLGAVTWFVQQRRVNALASSLRDAQQQASELSEAVARQTAIAQRHANEVAALETSVAQMRDAAADQLEVIEQLRTELQSAAHAKSQLADRARRIAQ